MNRKHPIGFSEPLAIQKIIYGLYIASILLPILFIVGVIVAYVLRNDSMRDWIQIGG